VRKHRFLISLATLALSQAFAAGCGDDSKDSGGSGGQDAKPAAPATTATAAAPGGAPVADAKVKIASFKYVPDAITLKAGGKVTWTNQDQAPHTATAKPASVFDTDTLNLGQSKTVTIEKPGTYEYFCVFHAFMVGKIVVK